MMRWWRKFALYYTVEAAEFTDPRRRRGWLERIMSMMP